MFNNPYMVYQPRFQQVEPNMVQPIAPMNNVQQPYVQPVQSNAYGLLGKQVESMDVVKATEVPFDGTVSYFPLIDGSAIITKKIQTDGTSKITIYKPAKEEKDDIKYATLADIEKAIKSIDFGDIEQIKDDLSSIKQQLKNFENIKKR